MDNNENHRLALSQYPDSTSAPEESRLIVQAIAGNPPQYSTEFYRLYFVESGSANATLDTWNLTVSPGDLIPLSPGEQAHFEGDVAVQSIAFHHDYFCVRVKRTEVYCDGVVFNRLTGSPRITLPEREWPLLRDRFSEIYEIVQAGGVFVLERSVNGLRSILLQAAEYKINQLANEPDMVDIAAPMTDLVLRFQDLLEANFLGHKNIGFYCEALNVTPSALNRHLKTELGQTTLQAINERVAIEARVELRSGRKSVKEVAIDLGFEDPLYFSRFFKKQFGHSPSHYFTNPPLPPG